MPVQSDYYCKVKPVCDRLAVLASQFHEKEFEKRFNFLEALCESWAQSVIQGKVPPTGSVTEVDDEKIMSPQREVNTVMYAEDVVSLSNEETLLLDNTNNKRTADHVQSEMGICQCCYFIRICYFMCLL